MLPDTPDARTASVPVNEDRFLRLFQRAPGRGGWIHALGPFRIT